MPRPWLAALSLSPLLLAQQGAWAVVPGDPAPPRWATGQMAFDRARGCTVLVNGSDVWESSGTAWRLVSSPPNTGGFGAGFAFDGNRQRCLWFGGLFFFSTQTLEWNGANWVAVTTAHAPSARAYTAMAYDAFRARMVLFGGWTGSAYPNDTWEFDGVDWQQVFPLASPPGVNRHRMAYDAARREIVLYSGYGPATGCWLYDGITWRATPPGPPAYYEPVFVHDEARGRTVLTSSLTATTPTSSTWEWDGTTWTNPQPSGPPLSFYLNGAYDSVRGHVEVVAGVGDGISTWGWNGTQWTRGTPFGTIPGAQGMAAAYHAPSGRSVAFGGNLGSYSAVGGLGDTYEYRRGGWRLSAPATHPAPRGYAAMAAEVSGDLLLMGGQDGLLAFADSWRWNGTTWTQLAPATSPPARSRHGMASDLARGRIVLFGGQDAAGTLFGDTWEWDGVTWSQLAAAGGPSPRLLPAMTYDPLRARTLLFGGGAATLFGNDLWQWDGATWTATTTAVQPTARGGGCFTFDPRGGVAVLAGGFTYNILGLYSPVAETWLWDGAQWTQVTNTAPTYSTTAVGVYHQELGSTLYSSPLLAISNRFAGDYEFAFGSLASASTFAAGCPGGTGVPLLSAMGVPRTGNREFGIWLCNAREGAFTILAFDWNTTSIPLGNGCQALLPGPVLATAVADLFGNVLLPLPIPASPWLHGLALHGQAVTLDPAGALYGLAAMTAGLRLVLD